MKAISNKPRTSNRNQDRTFPYLFDVETTNNTFAHENGSRPCYLINISERQGILFICGKEQKMKRKIQL